MFPKKQLPATCGTEKIVYSIHLFSHKANSMTSLNYSSNWSQLIQDPPDDRTLAKLHAVKPARQSHDRTRRAFPGSEGHDNSTPLASTQDFLVCFLGDQDQTLIPEFYLKKTPLDVPQEVKETWFPEVSCRCSSNQPNNLHCGEVDRDLGPDWDCSMAAIFLAGSEIN